MFVHVPLLEEEEGGGEGGGMPDVAPYAAREASNTRVKDRMLVGVPRENGRRHGRLDGSLVLQALLMSAGRTRVERVAAVEGSLSPSLTPGLTKQLVGNVRM